VTTHVLTNPTAARATSGRRERVRPRHMTLVGDEGNHELYFLCKRLIDAALSALLLVLVAPLLCVIAVAIKLETAGPVLFVQERVGARRRVTNGRTRWEVRRFPCFKFRSMVAGADESVHREYIHAFVHGQLGPASAAGAKFKLSQDNRITRVGRLLRKTSLDELPQLLNVLRGEMSLVGPRPVPPYEAAEYTELEVERLGALPGITGLWQVKGRAEVPFGEMVRMDREYVRSQSLWLDLQILAATIPVVLLGRGAR
jgi:lipopolysaccharide/colanic/teichoic acid biosynthesis glycosyltransferase